MPNKVKYTNNRNNEEFLTIGKIYEVKNINGADCVIDDEGMVKTVDGNRFEAVPYVPIERDDLRQILYNCSQKTLSSGAGFAIDRTGVSQQVRSSGFAVALSDEKLTHSNFIELVENRLDWLIEDEVMDNRICGVWIDEGIPYFDKGFNMENKESAIILGRMRNQKCIWSYAEKKEIWL